MAWNEEGFDGCWVIAMGTNEAANVAAGSTVGYDERIDSMMSVIGDEPALWVNVRSLVTSGPYAAANMAAWNAALLAACDRYRNMRVFDWASAVRDEWFIPDGIHFTTPGYAARAPLHRKRDAQGLPGGAPAARNRLVELPDQARARSTANRPMAESTPARRRRDAQRSRPGLAG